MASIAFFIGRICMSMIFILAAIGKFVDYNAVAQYMSSKGMTMVPFFLIVAAAVELIGGLSLLLGFKTRWGAALLILFLIPVTGIFHDFWMVQDPAERQMQMNEFLKNLAIWGGLFYVLAVGAGKWSLDSCCGCHTSDKHDKHDKHS